MAIQLSSLRSLYRFLLSTSLFALALGAASAGAATSVDGVWGDRAETAITRTPEPRRIVPSAYRTLALDNVQLSAILARTPLESEVPVARSDVRLSLPLADGSFGEFQIVESPIMEAELAARFPEIRTYLGQGVDDRTATLRFDLTPTGFHAQIISWEGTTYIDPFQPGDVDHYIAYRKRDVQNDGDPMRCLVTGQELPKDAPNFQKRGVAVNVASGTSLRTYRAAVAATGEYTAFHGGTVAGGLAAIVTTMNRVTGIYERDLSVRMVLVANNNLIVYTNGGTDPYTNNNGSTMLGQNQTNLTTVIGSANYDIGHVVSTGGGGIAGLGVVCNSGSKAQGVTGSPSPVGDAFDVDYVAHEIGHQFAGNHTFNGTTGSCGGGNRNASTAYEVGSGITIQAYAGICGADNVQLNSSDYFHRVSLNEMLAFTTNGATGASCGTATATGNTPPVVTTVSAFTIPRQTPFALTANGTDGNGDSLTYLWEHFNLGAANPSGSLTDNGGPLFRNYNPTTTPTRTFPALASILSGANGSTWELLPSTNRTMNFRVTARDNRAGGGGTNEAATALTVTTAAGPFLVTAPNTAVTWDASLPQTVTWDVAGTTAAPVSTATVRISLSLDGGASFPLVLATGEANDGSASVALIGATPTTQARIKVEAENNVYFDISNANFTITGNGPGVGVFVQSGGNTAVIEGGAGDSYTMALSAAPSASVTVTVGADAQLTRSPATLTFTTSNWATPQTVTVGAVDDALFEGAHTGTITHVANGGGYTNANLGNITASISDNDASLDVTGTQVTTGNNLIEPNECNQLNVTLSNMGAGPATGVSATLSTSTPNVTITQPNAAFADIPVGESRTTLTPFQISSASALVCFSNIDLTLTVTYSGNAVPFVDSFQLPVGQLTIGNYTFVSTTGATIPAGGTLVPGSQTDDGLVDIPVPAGFNFSVYGVNVAGGAVLRASTNGNLQLVASGGSAGWTNGGLPNAGSADGAGAFPASAPVLMPYWDDVDTGTGAVTGGGIYTQLTGSSPNRKFIVEWRGERVGQGGTAITTQFAIELNENSSQFAYVYALTGGGAAAGGAQATVGVQAATTGTLFTQYSFDTSSLSVGQRLTASQPGTGTCSSGTGGCSGAGAGVAIVQSSGSTAVTETGATDSYTIVLISQPTATVNVAISFPAGELTVGGDGDGTFNTTFTTGNWSTPQPISVAAVNDRALEGDHAGSLTHTFTSGDASYNGITAVVDGGAASNSLTVAISDNETAQLAWLSTSGSAAEGASNATTAQLDITANPTGGTPTLEGTISYTITPAFTTAEAADIGTATGALSFVNVTDLASNAIGIAHLDDTLVEGVEAYSQTLTLNPLPAGMSVTVAPTAFTGTITDNDSAVVNFAPASVSQSEGSSPMAFTVTLSNPVASGVTLTLNSAFGTALAADFTAISGATVSFPASSTTSQTVNVSISNDTLDESNEGFSLVLSNLAATGNVTLGVATATGTIVDDDAPPTLTINSPSQPEGNAGGSPMIFTASLSQVSGLDVSFSRATADGTATVANNDYVAILAGSLTIPAGQTSVAIPVTINGDTTFEGNETFTLNLTGVSNATPASLAGAGTIAEDDPQPTTTTITAQTPSTTVVGQPYTVSVNVAAQTLSPIGTVSITDGAASCGPVTLTAATAPNSTASCAITSTTAGSRSLIASYTPATTAFAASASAGTTHQVNPATTAISVSGPPRSRINQPTSFSFALSVSAPGAGTPAGTVTLTGGASSCNVTVPTATPSCDLTFTALGSRSVSAAFAPSNGNFTASSSSGAGNAQTLVYAQSDITVTKSNGVIAYAANDLLVYTVTVRNLGADAAANIRVVDNVPVGLIDVVWTCAASGGVVCPQAGGSGNIDATIGAFPVGSQLNYTFQGNVNGAPTQIVNTAMTTLPADTTIEDLSPGNNSATDTDVLDAVFANGFESAAVNAPARSFRLPGTALRGALVEVALVVFRLDDADGGALRLYARVINDQLEYAVATRNAQGKLRLAAWQRFSDDPTLYWQARSVADGWVLEGAELR